MRGIASLDGRPRRIADEQRDIRGDLVVARARGVQPPADRPRDLRQAALDRHVDVLVVGGEREAVVAQLALDGVETFEQRVAVGLRDHAARGEHPRVRPRLGDVVGP